MNDTLSALNSVLPLPTASGDRRTERDCGERAGVRGQPDPPHPNPLPRNDTFTETQTCSRGRGSKEFSERVALTIGGPT